MKTAQIILDIAHNAKVIDQPRNSINRTGGLRWVHSPLLPHRAESIVIEAPYEGRLAVYRYLRVGRKWATAPEVVIGALEDWLTS